MSLITINDNVSSVVCEQIVAKRELSVGPTTLRAVPFNPIIFDTPVEVEGNFTIGDSSTIVLGDLDGTNITGLMGGWNIPGSADMLFGEFDRTSGLLISQPLTASAGVPNTFIVEGGQSWAAGPISKELVIIVRPSSSTKFYFARHNTATFATTLVEKTNDFSTMGGFGTPGAVVEVMTLGNGGDGESIAFRSDTNELIHFSGRDQGMQVMESINPDTLVIGPNLFVGSDIGFSGSVSGSTWDSVREVWIGVYSDAIRRIPSNGVAAGMTILNYPPSDVGGISFTGTQLFAGAKSNTSLYEFDPDTGALIGTMAITIAGGGTYNGCTGMAYDKVNDVIYIIYKFPGSRRLGRLNYSTGVITHILVFGPAMAGIAFDNNGKLWVVSGDGTTPSETLFSIDGLIDSTNIDLDKHPGMVWDVANNRWLIAWSSTTSPAGNHIFSMDTTLAVTDLTASSAGISAAVCGVVLLGSRLITFLDNSGSVQEFGTDGELITNNTMWVGNFIFSLNVDFLPEYGQDVTMVFRAAALDESGKIWVVVEFHDGNDEMGGTMLGYILASDIQSPIGTFDADIHITTHMPKKSLKSLTYMA